MAKRMNVNDGERFGMLTIIKEVEPNITPCGTKQRRFLCKCDCGKEIERKMSTLLHGNGISCGCSDFKIGELNKKYTKEQKDSFLYSTWCGIKQRCYDEKSKNYHLYGERGIKMCDEWHYDYVSFYEWSLLNGAKKGLTIDRIDVNGNYEPSNCRWVDIYIQANNTRSNRHITYNGETHTLAEWSKITCINEATIRHRIDKYGFTIGQALGFEKIEYNKKPRYITYGDETHTVTEWARIVGINYLVISHRIDMYGFTVGQALGKEPYDYKNKKTLLTYNNETHSVYEWSKIIGITSACIKKRLKRGLTVPQALGFEPFDKIKKNYVPEFKKILEYDLDGNFVREWNSAEEAANFYKRSNTAIRYACNGVTKTCADRIWRYKE